VASLALELIFNTLLISLMAVVHTAFLIRLLSGRSITWMAQSRDGHEVPLSDAVRYFLPQTIIGVAAIGAVWNTPELLPFALFGALGMALAIPFAVLTASQAFGEWCIRRGICKLPEEFAPPPIFSALKVPAIEAARLDAPADSAASHAR
jgi:membrane glycosyltransferase